MPEKKLLAEALRYGVGSVTLDGLQKELKRQGVLVVDGQATTAAIRDREAFLIRFARDGRGKERPVVPELVEVRPLLGPGGDGSVRLTEEQEACLRRLAGSRDRLNVVDAGQGTGKTTLLEQYAGILLRHQVRTIWLGTTHTAVDELKARGLPAMTLARFLASPPEKAAGSRIILDEASMLAHADAERLCRFAQEQGCRLDLIGDTRQYKSPVAGNTVGLLARFGGVQPITMKKTMRQQGRLKEAMEAIRDGQVLQGHDMLQALGFVQEMPLNQLTQKAADLYLRWSAGGVPVPVISPTHAQADDISAKIREGLKARGDLKGEDRAVRRLVNLNWSPAQLKEARAHGAEGVTLLRYGAYREDTQFLAVGDLVKTTLGGTTKDGKHRLRAGQRYRITGFTPGGDPVLSNGWVVDKDWGGLVQGYVGTGQAAQGITAPRAIVVYGMPSLVATRREGFYVPVSRVRHEVAVLTDSNLALRQAIQRQDSRQTATELLTSPERDKASLKQWLGKHLAYLRRQAAFGSIHEGRPVHRKQERPLGREMDYAR